MKLEGDLNRENTQSDVLAGVYFQFSQSLISSVQLKIVWVKLSQIVKQLEHSVKYETKPFLPAPPPYRIKTILKKFREIHTNY